MGDVKLDVLYMLSHVGIKLGVGDVVGLMS